MLSLNVTYPAILGNFGRHLVKGRTESRAFLAWFLEQYYRLEETDAQDSVCDGTDDKGVDGVFVDDNFERVDIFQSRLVQNNAKTLGDTQLKEFVGTLAQFRDPSRLQKMVQKTTNHEFRNLMVNGHVADKLAKGYSLRGVFITNATRDANAVAYLAGQPNLLLYDAQELQAKYIPSGPTPLISGSASFDIFGFACAEYSVGQAKVIIAPLRAMDLVKMSGFANGELFAWNVRQSLAGC